MNQCQNCGQANNYESNFCRFCGTRMVLKERANIFSDEQAPPPRPYAWKTDEFQVPETAPYKSQQINQVQPLQNPATTNQSKTNQAFSYQPSSLPTAYGYRCPHCGSQNLPKMIRKISTAGWVVFAILMVLFFPLFWIGLLIKEEVKICPVCNKKVS